MIKITTPLTEDKIIKLEAGDQILLTGTIYTARDAAHKRLVKLIEDKEKLPFEIKNEVIYFVGPTPTKPGEEFGSGGPTTSGRMDKYSPILLDLGLKAMIGKGYRNEEVKEHINELLYTETAIMYQLDKGQKLDSNIRFGNTYSINLYNYLINSYLRNIL